MTTWTQLNRDDQIYLYGDNTLSRNAYHKLHTQRYNIAGIIDKKILIKQKLNSYLYLGLSDVRSLGNKEKAACIICLNNGLEHDNVATELHTLGFEKILYLPMMIKDTILSQHIYRESYRSFINGNYADVCIPQYVADYYYEFLVITKNSSRISFWCPKQMLRTGTKEQYKTAIKTRNVDSSLLKYTDCTIDEFTPYLSLFEALGKNSEQDASEYLQLQRNSDEDRQKLYQDRIKLFSIYEERFKYDMTFFMDSPAKVEWNKNGWLNIVDGLHRVYYLNYKGYSFYPVETSEDSFNSCSKTWKNMRSKN